VQQVDTAFTKHVGTAVTMCSYSGGARFEFYLHIDYSEHAFSWFTQSLQTDGGID
jgi:hypothetical protein